MTNTRENEMKTAITFQIEKSVGYRGNKAAKTWVALITGTDNTYIFRREFMETEAVDREEMFRARRIGKGSWVEAVACDVGLYEIQAGVDDRLYRVVFPVAEGGVKWCKIDVERATKMALLMDEGMGVEEARLATKPPKHDVPA